MWADDVNLDLDFGFGSGPLAAAPSFTDVSSDMRQLIIGRGRGSVHVNFDAGTFTARMDNRTGDFDPGNTASTYDPDLQIGTPVRIQATHDVTTYDLGYGHISRWPLDYAMPSDAIADIEVTENLAKLRTTVLNAEVYAEESTDTRIGNILDTAGWPAGARALDSGVAEAAAVTFTGTAGLLIDQTVEAEQGQFFIAKNGDATFKNRVAFDTAASQATFGPGGGELDFTSIKILYDDDLLINYALVEGAVGGPTVSEDSTSQTDHGVSGVEILNPSIVGAPHAVNVGEWLVGANKDVSIRVVGFTIQPQNDPTNLWPEVLDRELTDLVTVKFDPPGAGDTVNQIVRVESISHEIGPAVWQTTYTCHPLSTFESQSYWILGTSDDLDTNTRIA